MSSDGSRPRKRGTAVMVLDPRKAEEQGLVPTLTVVSGPRVGHMFRFRPGEENSLTFGRTADAQMVLSDPTVSSIHARFTWRPIAGSFQMQLEDLESTNGTRVNGEEQTCAFLHDGDQVHLGEVLLRYQCLSPAEIETRDRLIAKASEAETDALTGLGNRRYFEENVPRMLEDADAREIPVCMMLLDLDHFKQVNDRFGHRVGDEALRLTGKIILSRIRSTDIGIRYGGEEFAVFLPGSLLNEAEVAAERIRHSLLTFDCSFISPGLELTVSVGVTIRSPGEPLDRMVERVDAALYQAKSGGRDMVVAVDVDQRCTQYPDVTDLLEERPVEDGKDEVHFLVLKDLDPIHVSRLRSALIRVVQTRRKLICLDVSRLEHMDSAGMGVLVQLNRAVFNCGGKLHLRNARPDVQKILRVVKVDEEGCIPSTAREPTRRVRTTGAE